MLARFRTTLVVAGLLSAALPTATLAQTGQIPPPTERVKLSGPRFGVTFLGPELVDSLAAHDIDVSPVITQFGWQFERQFYAVQGGPAAVSEWVILVGGLEQGAFLPSVSWLVGLRTQDGAEFGVGPNLSAAGSALAIAAGITTRAGAMNLPLNVAVVPSKLGVRVSVLAGFTMR